MRLDDAVHLIGAQYFSPLAGAPLAKEGCRLHWPLAITFGFFLLLCLLERGQFERTGDVLVVGADQEMLGEALESRLRRESMSS